MYLVESLTNRYTTFFQFNLYQRQAIDQNGDIVAIGVRACLFKLLDDLHFIAKDVFSIQQIDILNTAIVEDEIMNIIIMNLAGLFNNAIAGLVHPGFHKATPFSLQELYIVKVLQLFPDISEHSLGVVQGWQVFIALVNQILNQLTLQITFALVALGNLPVRVVFVQNDKIIGLSNWFGAINHFFVPAARSHSCSSSDRATV